MEQEERIEKLKIMKTEYEEVIVIIAEKIFKDFEGVNILQSVYVEISDNQRKQMKQIRQKYTVFMEVYYW